MIKDLRSILFALALVALVAVSAAFALSGKPSANAQSRQGSPTRLNRAAHPADAQITRQEDGNGEINEDEGKGGDGEDNDGPLTARITPDQAKAAAVAAQPGTAGKTELESENGKTVYGVEVTAADGKAYDVKVDADSGKVLKAEADGADEGEMGEGEGESNNSD